MRPVQGVHGFVWMLGLVLFFLGAIRWWNAPNGYDPWRVSMMSAGLFCWCLSTGMTS